jgi:integrase/recombinase XerD
LLPSIILRRAMPYSLAIRCHRDDKEDKMAGHGRLEEIVSEVLEEMERLRYSEQTITSYRRMFAAYGRHAAAAGEDGFSEEGAVRFLNGKFGVSMEGLYGPNPGGSYLKAWLRAMRVLLEWSECGCICRRMAGGLSRTELPDGLQELLGSFEAASMAAGHSRQTVYTRGNRIKHFLLYLAEQGGTDASCIGPMSAHDYILTKASCHEKTVRTLLAVLRRFLRHLYLEGYTGADLSKTVPSPKPCYVPPLPAAWSAEDVEALMGSIDRGSPAGRRDYAMLLLVARLGLRASDIKALRISNISWGQRRISIIQHKTGVPLDLPLLDDVGWAIIDWLKARPEAATCPELFCTLNAPFRAFGATSNLTYILVERVRAAGIEAKGAGRTLHSFRHALAKRLLDGKVPIEDISRILGHASTRTTGIYLGMDIAELASCALDPEVGA